jgi:NADPH-dependent 2,4-dienoyl-CoA reductase/sulfur reductase-like enzyme
MFTLQTLGLILLFGLIGLLIGWLIRSFFCKPGLSGGTKMGASDASLKASGDSSTSGTLNKTATAAAGVAAVAATAAAVASSKKDEASDAVSGAIDSASDTASGAINTLTDTASNVADSASSAVSGAADSASDMASSAVDSTSGAVSGAMDSVTESASGAVDAAKNSVSGAIDSATDAVGSASASASGTLDSASETASSGISGAAAGAAGVAAAAAAAYSATSSAGDSETSDAAGTQNESVQQNEVTQLRTEAETLLNENFAATGGNSNGLAHIIIGAGPAGVVAAETIRKLDATANITVIGDEPEAPYSRMAIPYFLEENIQAEGTHLRKASDHYEDSGIQLLSGRVKSVDTENKSIETANGLKLSYDKLLIATGSHPLTPPIPGLDNPKVGNCWDLADSRKIIENVKAGSSVVQIGAGFIGCIILEALVKRGANLTVVEMDNRMVPRMLDEQCGGMLKSWCESKGVTVLTETQVKSIEDNGDRIKVNLSQGEAIDADYVISATGVASNTGFLEGSGIDVDQGVLVNHHLETNVPDVYAAGDVAQGIDFTTGGYSVHAIQPTAADHGTITAKNMVRGNKTRHKGSLQMNILSTLDLISTSYGAWEGVEGGEHSELLDADKYRYIRLQFKDDQLVGANTLGITQNIGALRGLIQNKSKLGVWKERLMENPTQFMDAYVSITGNHS